MNRAEAFRSDRKGDRRALRNRVCGSGKHAGKNNAYILKNP